MKKLFLIFFSLLILSCDDNAPESESNERNFSLSQTETLEVLLAKAIPIEGGYSISQQAQNFAISEIQFRENGLYYVYAPEEGFTGTELVKIKREDSNGATVYAETIITFNIQVKE